MSSTTTAADETVLDEFTPTYSAWFWIIVLTFGFGFIYAWQERRRTVYLLTDQRVVREYSSWVTSKTDEFYLDEVKRIQTSQSFGENILGGGGITLDTGVDQMEISGVPNHAEVVQKLQEVQSQ